MYVCTKVTHNYLYTWYPHKPQDKTRNLAIRYVRPNGNHKLIEQTLERNNNTDHGMHRQDPEGQTQSLARQNCHKQTGTKHSRILSKHFINFDPSGFAICVRASNGAVHATDWWWCGGTGAWRLHLVWRVFHFDRCRKQTWNMQKAAPNSLKKLRTQVTRIQKSHVELRRERSGHWADKILLGFNFIW